MSKNGFGKQGAALLRRRWLARAQKRNSAERERTEPRRAAARGWRGQQGGWGLLFDAGMPYISQQRRRAGWKGVPLYSDWQPDSLG